MTNGVTSSPFFSIIIPCRIISSYLIEETLPALAAQEYDDFEVIVLADTRTVSEERLQRDFPWLRFDHEVEGQKPGVKRDYGVKHARGSVVIFLDDDAWPKKNWLYNVKKRLNSDNTIHVLGGPGMMPPRATLWEQMINAVLISSLGSGGYAYRFIPVKERYVDDFPSMNMIVRKEVFAKVGGFQTTYWPGEDSKFLNALYKKTGIRLFYDPQVQVYHHRRSSLTGHIHQYDQYGYHRGTFFAQGDENSHSLTYAVPALFCIYLVVMTIVLILQLMFVFFSMQLFVAFMIPIAVYVLLLCYEFVLCLRRTYHPVVALSLFFFIPLTHIVYGLAFLRGVLQEVVKKVR